MLDAFKKISNQPAGKQASSRPDDPVQMLPVLEAAKAEREALLSVLSELEAHAARASQTNDLLQSMERRAASTASEFQRLESRTASVSMDFYALEARVSKVSSDFDRIDARSRETATEVHELMGRATATSGEVVKLETSAKGAAADFLRLENRVGKLEEQTRNLTEGDAPVRATIEEHLSALNVLAEHVGQKVRQLENQKQVVERAVLQSNRVSDMVWNMDLQLARMDANARRVEQTGELLERLERLAGDTTDQLELGVQSKQAFAEELERLRRERNGLVEIVRELNERRDLERAQIETSDLRMRALEDALGALENRTESVDQRALELVSVRDQLEAMTGRVRTLLERSDELEGKHALFVRLEEQFNELEEASQRTAWELEALRATRTDLDVVRSEIQEFYASYAAASELRDGLAGDRATFETFMDRAHHFSAMMPEFQARMDAVHTQLTQADSAIQRASLASAAVDALDQRMARLVNRQGLVERVEQRVSALSTLANEVDRKLQEQLARRAEVDGMSATFEAAQLKVADLQQKIAALGDAQASIGPLADRIGDLNQRIARSHELVAQLEKDETQLTQFQNEFVSMVAASRAVADDAKHRIGELNSLNDELKASRIMKEELIKELAFVRSRQFEVQAQSSAQESEIQKLQAMQSALEQRATQFGDIDRRIDQFEKRVAQVQQTAEVSEQQLQSMSAREAVISSVRREIESVLGLASQTRFELQQIATERTTIIEVKDSIQQMSSLLDETETKITAIDSRRRVVDDVQTKVHAILNLTQDVRVSLDSVLEQKAMMDQVLAKVGLLDEGLRAAQNTLQMLQSERELAERIEASIRLHRKGAAGADV